MRARGGSRGQATVELALLLPVLVMLVLGVLQVGLVARDRVVVGHATRAAARAAVVDPSAAAARSAATEASRLNAGRLTVTLSGDPRPGGLVTVRLTYRSPTDVPLLGRFLGDVEMGETLVARVE